MFFLGVSAHLFIYLLVPAFLVVCFYFRGTAGNPEAVTLLPEVVCYEHTIPSFSVTTYIYQIKQEEVTEKQKEDTTEIFLSSVLPFYQPKFLPAFSLTTQGLRAPPYLNQSF